MSSPSFVKCTPPPPWRMWLSNMRFWRERLAHRIVKFGLALAPEDNLTRYARDELRIAGMFDKDSDYGGMLSGSTIDLIKMFSLEGHSGGSASIQSAIFEKVSRFQPLTPLTGADDEWQEVGNDWFQNRRCSHVFKQGIYGQAYDNDGRVFREPSGACFTSRESRVAVTFPYTPHTEYVDVPAPDVEPS